MIISSSRRELIFLDASKKIQRRIWLGYSQGQEEKIAEL
jgi:hypothetical protein